MAVIARTSDRDRESMRRSALGSDQGPNEEQQSQGSIPGIYRSRMTGDLQDPTNVSFPFLHRIRRDHMVGMGLHFITMDALSAPWWVDGDDARVQAYADKLIRPIYGDLVQMILRFLSFGYSPGARNFTTAQPGWTYFENGESKKVWDNGAVDAIVYKNIIPLEPEVSRIAFKNGAFNGISYDARYGTANTFIFNGREVPSIDKLHSFWAVHDQIGENGSPYGFPRIAYCAPIFWMYRWIWDLIARGFENSFDPGPVMRFPEDEGEMAGRDGSAERPIDKSLRVGSRRRTGSTIALPSTTYKDMQERATSIYKWNIEYPEMRTDFTSVLDFIGYLEAAKLNSLFMPEQSLTEGRGSSSSRNVAENFSDQRSSSQNVLMGQIHKFIDEVFIAPVIAMVFPLYQGELSIKSIGAGSAANDLLRQVFQLAGQENYKRFGIDLRRLAEANQFPMLSPEEQQKELEEQQKAAADIANQSQTPEVKPAQTQGRRSQVTQTGFNEMSYHRLEGKIPLSRDGDFVTRLPKTDVFADSTVVAHTRELRSAVERMLTWAHGDFALAISKRSDVLSDDAATSVSKWQPEFSKIEDNAKAVRRALAKIYDRASWLELKRLGRSERLVEPADLLDTWTADIMGRAIDVARLHFTDAVREGIELEEDRRQIAARVRSTSNQSASSAAAGIARRDSQRMFNQALVAAGDVTEVAFAQIVDECCGGRHGKIVSLGTAAGEEIDDPRCSMYLRLLPNAPDDLSVRRETLEADSGAMYDEETETILVDPQVSQEDEAQFMIALAGAAFR